MSQSKSTKAGSLFTSEPTPVVFAFVILAALIVLALLRHFFGSINVSLGTH